MGFAKKRTDLKLIRRHFRSQGKAVIASLMAGLVLLLGSLASSSALHGLIHADADSPTHQCAATMFAHGQVDSAAVNVSPVTPPVSIEIMLRLVYSVFSPTIENLPAGRAPPAASSIV